MNRVTRPVSRYFDLLRGTSIKGLRGERRRAIDGLKELDYLEPNFGEIERALGRWPRNIDEGRLGHNMVRQEWRKTLYPRRAAEADKAFEGLVREEDLVRKARVGTLIAATGLAAGGGALHSHLKAKKRAPEGGEKTAASLDYYTAGAGLLVKSASVPAFIAGVPPL